MRHVSRLDGVTNLAKVVKCGLTKQAMLPHAASFQTDDVLDFFSSTVLRKCRATGWLQPLADGLNFTDNPCLLQKASHFFFNGYRLYFWNPAHPLWDIVFYLFHKKKNFTSPWITWSQQQAGEEKSHSTPLWVEDDILWLIRFCFSQV